MYFFIFSNFLSADRAHDRHMLLHEDRQPALQVRLKELQAAPATKGRHEELRCNVWHLLGEEEAEALTS